MGRRFIALALGALLASCAPPGAQAGAQANAPPQPESAPPAEEAPTAKPGGGDAPACTSDHVFDPVAKSCRLFPGGGYGWAGCSLSKGPPKGEQCVTGTRWAECDCACDDAKTKWDPKAIACR